MMQRRWKLIVTLLTIMGCESTKTHKVDNPVMGPAPPRITSAEKSSPKQPTTSVDTGHSEGLLDPTIPKAESPEEIAQTAYAPTTVPSANLSQQQPLFNQQVVATVNGSPIFASELLERYAPQLAKARKQLPPEDFSKIRNTLVRRDLKQAIQRKLLTESMSTTMENQQLEQLHQYLEHRFQAEVDRLKNEFNVHTKLELQQKLQEQGTSLARLKDDFTAQRMAMEFMGSKAPTKQSFSRPELLEYYRDHQEDYAITARAKWQHIRITFAKYGGKQPATKVLDAAVMELLDGADFGDVARRYSDGPKAAEDGHWPWTTAGSLANEQIDKALFELAIGDVSQVMISDRDFRVVKIIEREDSGRIPFAEVQSEIQKTLKQQAHVKFSEQLIEELTETAIIETIFDQERQ